LYASTKVWVRVRVTLTLNPNSNPNSEVAVEPTREGVAFSTDMNDVISDIMKPLMWYEISDPDGWVFSLTYQIDVVTSNNALGGGGYGGGEDDGDYGDGDDDDHEGFPIHMVITTVNPSEANYIVWPEVDYLGFSSFTVVYDKKATAEDSHGSSSHITLNRYNPSSSEGYKTVKEYFNRSTHLREGIAIEAPPFMAPAGHNGPLYVVAVGVGHVTHTLKFVELGKTRVRSTMPVQYSCHARSHAFGDGPPKLDCALASGRKSKRQCSSAWKYAFTYEGDESGCVITAERGRGPWCVLATDENGLCKDGCKDEDEGVTWDYCMEPIEREECVEFCSKTVSESGEVCAEDWYPWVGEPIVPSCTSLESDRPWCAIRVCERDNFCAGVCNGIFVCT
jgi:hypothetical protein